MILQLFLSWGIICVLFEVMGESIYSPKSSCSRQNKNRKMHRNQGHQTDPVHQGLSPVARSPRSDLVPSFSSGHQTGPGATSTSRQAAGALAKQPLEGESVHHWTVRSKGPMIFINKNQGFTVHVRRQSSAHGPSPVHQAAEGLMMAHCSVVPLRHWTNTIAGQVHLDMLQFVFLLHFFLHST